MTYTFENVLLTPWRIGYKLDWGHVKGNRWTRRTGPTWYLFIDQWAYEEGKVDKVIYRVRQYVRKGCKRNYAVKNWDIQIARIEDISHKKYIVPVSVLLVLSTRIQVKDESLTISEEDFYESPSTRFPHPNRLIRGEHEYCQVKEEERKPGNHCAC